MYVDREYLIVWLLIGPAEELNKVEALMLALDAEDEHTGLDRYTCNVLWLMENVSPIALIDCAQTGLNIHTENVLLV